MAIKITGTFTPSGDFGLVNDTDLIGGYQTVATTTDRDSIPVLKRKWGMLIYNQEDSKFYQLIDQGNGDLSDNSNWVETNFSGGSNYTFVNGLTENNGTITWGGQLEHNTTVSIDTYTFMFDKGDGSSDIFKLNYDTGYAYLRFQKGSVFEGIGYDINKNHSNL